MYTGVHANFVKLQARDYFQHCYFNTHLLSDKLFKMLRNVGCTLVSSLKRCTASSSSLIQTASYHENVCELVLEFSWGFVYQPCFWITAVLVFCHNQNDNCCYPKNFFSIFSKTSDACSIRYLKSEILDVTALLEDGNSSRNIFFEKKMQKFNLNLI